ncbi:hypothetical protein [Kosakonia sp. S42]|uniref:hypothetical protein n=1 Tax=Kosakonia sp. S42 TaxID=2767458 RepID=UPI00190DD579|nr:hypothetical protein [Kosakonia sp. S42]MBK0019510.1 hypothetical protein [Kosakonia sp. S42]
MSETLFHCTFTDRDMAGHVHQYKQVWRKKPYVYVACIVFNKSNEVKVFGGSVILTDHHHSEEGFMIEILHSLLMLDVFKHIIKTPFIIQPFQISRLASDFPISEKEYYEILFEKYLNLSVVGNLMN